MPLKTDTADIRGYYDESWVRQQRDEIPTFAVLLAEAIEAWSTPFERWPVRNREPRTPIAAQKRAIIHERDGDICRMCGIDHVILTVDHIIPRSAFRPEDLHIADRSDNLISACGPCNEAKSNYERHQRKRLGVTAQCWYCAYGEPEDNEPLPYPVNVPVFCGRCGVSRVPAVNGWIL